MCAPKKSGVSQRFSVSKHARSTSGTQFVQACICLKFKDNKDTMGIIEMLFKVKMCDAVSCVYCQLWAFLSCKTFHSIQHCFYKTNTFHISCSFNSHFFIVLWLQHIFEILNAITGQRENSFFFTQLRFLTLTSSNSKGPYYFEMFSQAN